MKLSPSRQLIARLRKEIEWVPPLPDDVVIKRSYASGNMLAAGCFSWYLSSLTRVMDSGSCSTVAKLLKCKRLSICNYGHGDDEIVGDEDS